MSEKGRMVSGAIHYFRIHPSEWGWRLDQAVRFGLNTIETYVAWNLHEPHRGEFHFEGLTDLIGFVQEVAAHGLDLILRPGPYICSEWENGGLPAWLTGRKDLRIRCNDAGYLAEVEHWYGELLPRLVPYQKDHGGPIVMMQVENEYGSYGEDHEYMAAIRDMMRKYGITVPLFTSDGPWEGMLNGGTLPDIRQTVNFGSNPENAFRVARKYRPDDPLCCMEFWDGWFDHWGEDKHHLRSAEDTADTLERMLALGADVNFYMFSGGTNFGFTAGANGNRLKEYAPTITSYDYDAPLSEAGDPTEKFRQCQAVIRKYAPNGRMGEAPVTPKMFIPPVKFTSSAPVLGNLGRLARQRGKALNAPTMDELGETFGFIHYRTRIEGPIPAGTALYLFDVNDYAQVWVNGAYLGTCYREQGENALKLPEIGKEGATLDLLVENLGRINYGPWTGLDYKGIVNCVTVGWQRLIHWEYETLDFAEPDKAEFGAFAPAEHQAILHKAEFELQDTASTYLKRPGKKGAAWLNGFPLGRYWERGPQQTLYVPRAVLNKGKNTLILLEQEGLLGDTAEFTDTPDLGVEQKMS